MILIEFCGAPGVGKSTVSGALIEGLLKEQVSVLTRNDILFRGDSSSSKIRDLALSIIIHPVLSFFTYTVALEYGIKANNFRYASRLLKLIYLLEKAISKNEYQICVLDEGVVQYLTSIPHDKIIKDTFVIRKLIYMLQKLFPDSRFVFCNLEKEIICKRLINREKSGSRIALLSSEQKKQLIDVRVKNMNYIRDRIKSSQVYNVDMSQTSEQINWQLRDMCMRERKI